MSEINLIKKSSLMIPEKFELYKLINFLESATNKDVTASLLEESTKKDFVFSDFNRKTSNCYTALIKNNNEQIEGFLDIDTENKNGIYITTISQIIEGTEVDGKELYKKESNIIDLVYRKFNGLLSVESLRIIDCCNLDKTCYTINYEKDSADYKLIELLLDNTGDPFDTLYITQLLKNNKTQLLDVLK